VPTPHPGEEGATRAALEETRVANRHDVKAVRVDAAFGQCNPAIHRADCLAEERAVLVPAVRWCRRRDPSQRRLADREEPWLTEARIDCRGHACAVDGLHELPRGVHVEQAFDKQAAMVHQRAAEQRSREGLARDRRDSARARERIVEARALRYDTGDDEVAKTRSERVRGTWGHGESFIAVAASLSATSRAFSSQMTSTASFARSSRLGSAASGAGAPAI
jgi:hypothetical protein